MALRAEIAARGIISSDNEYTITAAIVIGCPSKKKAEIFTNKFAQQHQ